jgi:ThiF family
MQEEGYTVEIRSTFLLVHDIPFVTPERTLGRGTLVSTLNMAGDVVLAPDTHVVTFTGLNPSDANGRVLHKIINSTGRQEVAPGVVIEHIFSSKPQGGYADYYEKMTAYANMLAAHAAAIEPSATPRVFAPVADDGEDGPFHYLDTASSRADLVLINNKVARQHIAIIGLGGTGAYVLDLVAKTHIGELHAFDGDRMRSHNAFRSPGAPSLDELRAQPFKVDYFTGVYRRMRRQLEPHPYYLDESNVRELAEFDFVFICIDHGPSRKLLFQALEDLSVPFIDVGMGVEAIDGRLTGLVRVSTSAPGRRSHLWDRPRINFATGDEGNDYAKNIQIAELNALNAALAVIRWKKAAGIYLDLEYEYFSTYSINGNHILNEDQACQPTESNMSS